ncbi:MAG: hypothetical protein WD512_07030 [Candidatus Paceibacterota bacterium]
MKNEDNTQTHDSVLDSVLVPVHGIYLGISDMMAAYLDIKDKVHSARYQIRDEDNQITWVHDRLLGLTPNTTIELLEQSDNNQKLI